MMSIGGGSGKSNAGHVFIKVSMSSRTSTMFWLKDGYIHVDT